MIFAKPLVAFDSTHVKLSFADWSAQFKLHSKQGPSCNSLFFFFSQPNTCFPPPCLSVTPLFQIIKCLFRKVFHGLFASFRMWCQCSPYTELPQCHSQACFQMQTGGESLQSDRRGGGGGFLNQIRFVLLTDPGWFFPHRPAGLFQQCNF